jgi:hypothetical protein
LMVNDEGQGCYTYRDPCYTVMTFDTDYFGKRLNLPSG